MRQVIGLPLSLYNITSLVTHAHAEKMKALLGYNYPSERVLELGASSKHEAVNGAFCNILHV